MYKLIDRKVNIKSVAVYNDMLLIGNSFEVLDDKNNILLKEEDELQELYCRNTHCYINTIMGNGYYFEKNFNAVRVDGFIQFIEYPNILGSRNLNGVKNVFISDISSNSFVEIPGSSTTFFVSDYVYYRKNIKRLSIEAFSCIDGTIKWEYSLLALEQWKINDEFRYYDVFSFIGLWQQYLLVHASDDNLLVLNIEDGQLLQRLELKKHLNDTIRVGNGPYKIHLDRENNRIIWLSYSALVHIDLNTYSVKLIKDFFNVPRDNQWIFHTSTLHNGKIYFTADCGMEYVVPTRVGFMNGENGEILWQTQLYKTKGLTKAPIVCGNKMYVLALSGDLYVFEEE